jgi:hypothetical protein
VSIPNKIDESMARSLLLRAIKTRADTGDLIALGDISQALEDLDRMVADGVWIDFVRKAIWLLERAEGS